MTRFSFVICPRLPPPDARLAWLPAAAQVPRGEVVTAMSINSNGTAKPGEWLGGCSGDVAEAVDFALEVAVDWGQRVVVRLDGPNEGDNGRTFSPERRLLWTVFAA